MVLDSRLPLRRRFDVDVVVVISVSSTLRLDDDEEMGETMIAWASVLCF